MRFLKSRVKKMQPQCSNRGVSKFFLTMIKDAILAWGGFLIASRCLSSKHFKVDYSEHTCGKVVKLPPMSLNQDSRSVTWVVSGLTKAAL